MQRRRNLVAVVGLWLAASGCGSESPGTPDAGIAEPPDAGSLRVRILAINDFHGNLESPGAIDTGAGPVPAGGVDVLAAHLEAASLGPEATIIVSAGDLVGGSPLISALFHDEPTIEAMNHIGLALNVIGNHELDEDLPELQRLSNGGCHPVDGCFGGDGFDGADFSFLAANAVDATTGQPVFAPYEVRTLSGVKIAFIGLASKNTPLATTPITGVDFLDEAATANTYVSELRAQGVENIVVVVHEGGQVAGGPNECVWLTGRIVDIVEALDPAVDLVISGHTHGAYDCVVNGIPLSSAAALGLYYSEIDLEISAQTQLITAVEIVNRPVVHDVAPSAALTALVDRYRELTAPLANEVVGQITGDLPKASSLSGESVLGDVVADAMLAATPGADLALQQLGGLRADLLYAATDGETADGQVRYGEVFAVQPFQNLVVTMTLTGQELHDLLEEQWTRGLNPPLQISSTLQYTWSASGADGDLIDPASILVNGSPLEVGADYRITTNSFLATGGANYTVFAQGRDVETVIVDVDALTAYIRDNSPLDPPSVGRIVRVP